MQIAMGIASSTHIDLHNERMSKEALLSMATQINDKYIPLLKDHNPNLVIGVNLYSCVKELPDGEFALYVVQGIFDSQFEANKHRTGTKNSVWGEYCSYLDEPILPIFRPSEKSSSVLKSQKTLAEIVEMHLDSTQVLEDGTVYKVKRLIERIGDLEIHVRAKDHPPVHFHVISQQRGINARFDIFNLIHISNKKGEISTKDIKKIQNLFQTDHIARKKLLLEYERLNS